MHLPPETLASSGDNWQSYRRPPNGGQRARWDGATKPQRKTGPWKSVKGAPGAPKMGPRRDSHDVDFDMDLGIGDRTVGDPS
jgi:hypothetical protein